MDEINPSAVAPSASEEIPPLPEPRPEIPKSDTEILNDVLATQARVQAVIEEVATLLNARGTRKAKLRESFTARHGDSSPEDALADASLQLMGLQQRAEQARRDRAWIEANKPPKPPKLPKAQRPKRRRFKTLDQMRPGRF